MDLLDAGHRHSSELSAAGADMDGATVLPLSGAAYQPYVSELLSFSIERLHKVRPRSPLPLAALDNPYYDRRW
jgi:hypothetical protein